MAASGRLPHENSAPSHDEPSLGLSFLLLFLASLGSRGFIQEGKQGTAQGLCLKLNNRPLCVGYFLVVIGEVRVFRGSLDRASLVFVRCLDLVSGAQLDVFFDVSRG